MKQKIFPYDFAPYYPVGVLPCPMYVNVANRIYNGIEDMDLDLPYPKDIMKEIAINVAIYFEDKMSGIGLWNAFVAIHSRTYKRQLPFYDNFSELYDDDVNFHDVQLLVWLVISRRFNDRFINPSGMGFDAARAIMSVLDEDDEVEVNDALCEFIYNAENANDYFKMKQVLIWLRRSYLLCSPLSEERFNGYLDTFRKTFFSEGEKIYYAETAMLMTTEIGPMAMLPHLWLADMFSGKGMKDEADKLRGLRYCQQEVFEVINASRNYAILKDSKGEEYKLANDYPDMLVKGKYVFTALVKYGNNDWEINGILLPSDSKVYSKRCERNKQLAVSYEHAFPIYMERTKGKRLAFFETREQVKEWLMTVSPEAKIDEMCSHLPPCPLVAFVSKKAGIIFAPDIVHAVKSKDNPYYRKCDAHKLHDETMNAVINYEAVHPELLEYLLENKMLPDGDVSAMHLSQEGNEIFTRNIDFIARQHRRHYYYDHGY